MQGALLEILISGNAQSADSEFKPRKISIVAQVLADCLTLSPPSPVNGEGIIVQEHMQRLILQVLAAMHSVRGKSL